MSQEKQTFANIVSLRGHQPRLFPVVFIKYGQNVFHDGWERSFCRFDYGDEWNNHGYGRVLENGIWGIGELVKFKSENTNCGILSRGKK